METYLFEDLYALEASHWWHIAKRELVMSFFKRFVKKVRPVILDCGCGAGKNMEAFGSIGEVWGVDVSKTAIAFCRKRGLKRVVRGDIAETKFRKGFFDAVTLLDVLEHTDESKTLQEIKRILKPRGCLIITVPAYPWLWSKWDEVLHHRRRYTKRTLKLALHKSGFSILTLSYAYSFLVVPVFFIRWVKSQFPRQNYGSDFRIGSPILNHILLTLARFEQQLVRRGRIPFGTSIVCVAQRED